MGIITFSIPKPLVKKITQEIKFINFIETGTFEGGTSFWAANHFEKVFTIEIDPIISRNTSSKLNCPKNIEFLVGNSKDILPTLAKQLKGRSFFWLDGHWCGGAGKDEECPLMLELEAIKDQENSVIFIDDARCFLGPPPSPHNPTHWPKIDEIFEKLRKIFPTYFTTIQDDVIMSVPPDVEKIINEDWVKNFDKRFTNEQQEVSKTQKLKKLFWNR